MSKEELEKELSELKEDIRALRNIEIAHASGLVPPPQAMQTRDPNNISLYNTAVERLNRRYA